MTLRVLHFSDVHVQLEGWRLPSLRRMGPLRIIATGELWKGRGRAYEGAEEKVRAIVRDAQRLRPDVVLCTGDFTQLGHAEEFARARAALEPIASDAELFLACAGNHDRYPLGGKPNRLFEQTFPEQQRSDLPGPLRVRLVGEDVAFIFLDSAGAVSWPSVSPGSLEPAQLQALDAALHHPALARRGRFVVVHHAPTKRGRVRDWPRADLRGASALLAVAAAGGAEAILCGHVHERRDEPARPGRPRVICAGSSTQLGREGYFELHIERGRLVAAVQRAIGGAPAPA